MFFTGILTFYYIYRLFVPYEVNYFDIILVIILGASTVRGFFKGFISQLAALAALLLGIWVAIQFSAHLSPRIASLFNISSAYLPFISFCVIFISVLILVHLGAKVIQKMVESLMLGMANRILGALFALIKTTFIISIFLLVLNKLDAAYNIFPEEKVNSSLLYKPLAAFAPLIFPYLHFDELRERIQIEKQESEDNIITI